MQHSQLLQPNMISSMPATTHEHVQLRAARGEAERHKAQASATQEHATALRVKVEQLQRQHAAMMAASELAPGGGTASPQVHLASPDKGGSAEHSSPRSAGGGLTAQQSAARLRASAESLRERLNAGKVATSSQAHQPLASNTATPTRTSAAPMAHRSNVPSSRTPLSSNKQSTATPAPSLTKHAMLRAESDVQAENAVLASPRSLSHEDVQTVSDLRGNIRRLSQQISTATQRSADRRHHTLSTSPRRQ